MFWECLPEHSADILWSEGGTRLWVEKEVYGIWPHPQQLGPGHLNVRLEDGVELLWESEADWSERSPAGGLEVCQLQVHHCVRCIHKAEAVARACLWACAARVNAVTRIAWVSDAADTCKHERLKSDGMQYHVHE